MTSCPIYSAMDEIIVRGGYNSDEENEDNIINLIDGPTIVHDPNFDANVMSMNVARVKYNGGSDPSPIFEEYVNKSHAEIYKRELAKLDSAMNKQRAGLMKLYDELKKRVYRDLAKSSKKSFNFTIPPVRIHEDDIIASARELHTYMQSAKIGLECQNNIKKIPHALAMESFVSQFEHDSSLFDYTDLDTAEATYLAIMKDVKKITKLRIDAMNYMFCVYTQLMKPT